MNETRKVSQTSSKREFKEQKHIWATSTFAKINVLLHAKPTHNWGGQEVERPGREWPVFPTLWGALFFWFSKTYGSTSHHQEVKGLERRAVELGFGLGGSGGWGVSEGSCAECVFYPVSGESDGL